MPSTEKERALIEKIEKAKQALLNLKEKRKREIGSLACKHGLDRFDSAKLNAAFENLAKELINEPA
ncbi:MAG: hypothetical protein NTU49_02145 [Gammaproteobacteria bacterium]|nr:hypothetical protein [Gammaproteobacteria bacterium]